MKSFITLITLLVFSFGLQVALASSPGPNLAPTAAEKATMTKKELRKQERMEKRMDRITTRIQKKVEKKKKSSWWSEQDSNLKLAIILGAIAVGLSILWAVFTGTLSAIFGIASGVTLIVALVFLIIWLTTLG